MFLIIFSSKIFLISSSRVLAEFQCWTSQRVFSAKSVEWSKVATSMQKLTLGIDIGTTTSKILIYNPQTETVIYSTAKSNDAYIKCALATHKEQSVRKIIKSLEECLAAAAKKLGIEEMEKICTIGICGQMHGCMLWTNQSNKSELFDSSQVSNLITWQDQRCSKEFLKRLPSDNESPIPLSTGFGCATLFWMKENDPDILNKYAHSGTIMDYVVMNLCGLEMPVMSDQNAVGWGYFCPKKMAWKTEILKSSAFPVNLLPCVQHSTTIAGYLKCPWHGIKQGTTVYTAMGDLQCSVLSCQPTPSDAVFNLSTSAQISKVLPTSSLQKASFGKMVTILPYFEGNLMTFASLNGGSVYEEFVAMVFRWTKLFNPNVTMNDVYKQLEAEHNIDESNGINIHPTLYGERHDPDTYASITNMQVHHFNLNYLSKMFAKAIVENCINCFNQGCGTSIKFSRVWACGSCFKKNKNFLESLTQCIPGIEVRLDRDLDSSHGAAIVASNKR